MLSASLLFIHLIGCSLVLMKCCIRFGFIFLLFLEQKTHIKKNHINQQKQNKNVALGLRPLTENFPDREKVIRWRCYFLFSLSSRQSGENAESALPVPLSKETFPCKIFAKLFIHSHARIKYQFLFLVRQVLFLIKMYESLEEERRRKRESRSRKVKRGEMSVLWISPHPRTKKFTEDVIWTTREYSFWREEARWERDKIFHTRLAKHLNGD